MAQAVTVGPRGEAPGPRGEAPVRRGVAPADIVNKWWVLITVVFGAFVSILDSTIVNTALPKIEAVFGSGLHEASYVLTGYIMAQGVIVPATGFLANRYGIKRIYLASLALFTLGSALCGLAWSMGALIFFRVLQGAGGAALFPLSFAILFQAFAPEERGRANGFFGIPVLVAPAIGPTLGGYIVQYVDWRWIFYINVPIGIAGVILGRRVLRETPLRRELIFDLPGFAIAAASLGLLLYGLSNLAYDGWNSTTTVSGPIIIGAILFAVWIAVELRTRQPLLDLTLFKRRNYLIGALITWIGTVGIFGPAFLIPQYLQILRGLDPFRAGLLLFTSGVGSVIGTIASGQLFNRVGPRVLIPIGALIVIVTSWWLHSWATLGSAFVVLPWILLLRGVGLPMTLQSANTSALDGITGRALPGATTLSVVTRSIVASLAVALLANDLTTQQLAHYAHLSSQIALSNPAVAALYHQLVAHFTSLGLPLNQAQGAALARIAGQVTRQSFALAYQDVFLVTALVTIPVIVLGLLMRRPRNRAVPAANAEA